MTAHSIRCRLVPALLVLTLLVPASAAFAQADPADSTGGAMRAGAWAVQFAIGDNFDLHLSRPS